MDLSSPEDPSVNDGITKESCSFHYTSINEAAVQVLDCGPSTLMAKKNLHLLIYLSKDINPTLSLNSFRSAISLYVIQWTY